METGRAPGPVAYARGLVTVQGASWLVVSAGVGLLGWLAVAQILAGHSSLSSTVPWVAGLWVAAVLFAGCGAAEIWLAGRLRPADRWSWATAFGAECVMAALGWLLLYPLLDLGFVNVSGGVAADFLLLPVPAGGLLSLAAAAGLLLPGSRRYFAVG